MYTIKEISQKCNISISKIRYLDRKNILRPKIKRDENNYRVFTNEDIIWINDIICFQNAGLTIEQISQIKGFYAKNDFHNLELAFLSYEQQIFEKLQNTKKAHQRVLEKIKYYQNKQGEKQNGKL